MRHNQPIKHIPIKPLAKQPAPMQMEEHLAHEPMVRRLEMKRPRKNNLAALFKTGE